MITTKNGEIVINEDDMLDILYTDIAVNNIVVDDSNWIKQYNESCKLFDISSDVTWSLQSSKSYNEFVEDSISNWNMPKDYYGFDISSFLYSKCKTQNERNRVSMELRMFADRNMMLIIRWLKYFVDTMTEQNMIWGVGRGSSVSSYVLFLIGVHRVDSLMYNLDISEFLK